MRKLITAGLAALTLGGSLAAVTVTPAEAAPHGGGGWHGGGGGFHGGGGWHGGGWHGGGAGWAVGAGLAGLAVGAALADRPYYDGYYGYGYGPGYYDGDGGTCVGHRRYWDPYVRGYVVRRVYYPC